MKTKKIKEESDLRILISVTLPRRMHFRYYIHSEPVDVANTVRHFAAVDIKLCHRMRCQVSLP